MTMLRPFFLFSVVLICIFFLATSAPAYFDWNTEYTASPWIQDLSLQARPQIMEFMQTHEYVMNEYSAISYMRRPNQDNSAMLFVMKIFGNHDFIGGYIHVHLSFDTQWKLIEIGQITTSHTDEDPLSWD